MALTVDNKELEDRLADCEKKLAYSFDNIKLLENALTHTSFKTAYSPSNERLEFLGDAILGMVISEYLFKKFPDYSEGKLTKIKSVVVSRATLAKIGTEMGLKQFISVGKGLMTSRSFPKSLIANVFEAIIAAIYFDSGLKSAYDFTLRCLKDEIDTVCNNKHDKNYKSMLQHFCQRQQGHIPRYKIIKQSGPDHDKQFEIVLELDGNVHSSGCGKSIKEAEQAAAKKSLELIQS